MDRRSNFAWQAYVKAASIDRMEHRLGSCYYLIRQNPISLRSTSVVASPNQNLDQPFPLKRQFLRQFVPAFLAFVLFSLALIGWTAKTGVEAIYLDLAQRRAQTISHAVAEHAPAAWKEFVSGRTVDELKSHSEVSALLSAFRNEVREMRLSELKVYNLERVVLFATHEEEIGTIENGDALRAVIQNSTPEIVTKVLGDGSKQYELYVPVFNERGELRTIFELYEPIGGLDEILLSAAVPSVAVPGLLLILLVTALYKLVSRAQGDINVRSQALYDLRKRIESLVSTTAINAVRNVTTDGSIQSRNVTTTLFFSDIRDFTGYADQNTPETVVDFLNRIMTLQLDIIKHHDGDVDKMIGDAVLARFDGANGDKRALAAAREIVNAVKLGDFPRTLGIGIFQGEVISGAIGPEDRRDFTVIGNTVNMAARLCSAAEANEIVVEADLADEAFGPTESILVKGRKAPLSIRRWHS
jgi:adenylate cyclase